MKATIKDNSLGDYEKLAKEPPRAPISRSSPSTSALANAGRESLMSPQTLKKGKFSSAFETVHYNKQMEDQMRQFETFISPKAEFFNKFVHEIALKFMKFGSNMYQDTDISDILPTSTYMQKMKIGCETYHPTFVKLFGEMIILSTRDTKSISVIDLDTLSEVENIDLKSFAHCIQLVNGKLLAASFHGQVIDIFGIGKCNARKFR